MDAVSGPGKGVTTLDVRGREASEGTHRYESWGGEGVNLH